MADLADTYPDPVRIAVIGGTGLRELPGFEKVASLSISTPWGAPSSQITILHHPSPSTGKPSPIAFLSRHGLHHHLAPHEVPSRANIAALRSLGVRTIVAFSAVGSLQEHIRPRDFLVPDQIIDRTKGVRPWTFFEGGLVGHVPFADPFDERVAKVVRKCGHSLEGEGVKLHDRGTLVCMVGKCKEGPQFSTRAESNLYRSWSASVINMSALPEAKLAREAEIGYQMICMSTDYDCWRVGGEAGAGGDAGGEAGDLGGGDEQQNDHHESVSVEMVAKHMAANATNALRFLAAVLDELSKDEYKDIVMAKHLEGMIKGATAVTGHSGRDQKAVEKMRWLFPEYF
ncbi:MAG: hypothetical protein M1823_004326 [Watsoniomyces obsoletus]|nr:MAG: hypothetical protein M1823_004326 [Watsoniomyces obsoletus]